MNAINSQNKKPTNFFDVAATVHLAALNTIHQDTIGNQHIRSDIQKQAYTSDKVKTIRQAYGITGTNFNTHTPYIDGNPVDLDAEVKRNSEVILIKHGLHVGESLVMAGYHRILPWRTEPSSGSDQRLSTAVITDSMIIGGPPAESFAPNGKIVSGASNTIKSKKTLINAASYALDFGATQVTISATGSNSIFGGFTTKIGKLIKSPCHFKVPLIFDPLQNNVGLEEEILKFNRVDSGFDSSGLLGKGTYVLGNGFSTTYNSVIPSRRVRQDFWDDVFGFFSEPETDQGPFNLTIMGNLSGGVLYDHADSVFADNLFKSGISDGIIVIEAELTGDPMKAAEDGAIVCAKIGTITIGYGGSLSLLYPQITISPIGTE